MAKTKGPQMDGKGDIELEKVVIQCMPAEAVLENFEFQNQRREEILRELESQSPPQTVAVLSSPTDES